MLRVIALLAVLPAAAQSPNPNGFAKLAGPAAPATGGTIIVKGTITGNKNGYQIPSDYAQASLGIYAGGRGELSVPIRWDSPLPAVLNAGDVLSFSAAFPAARLLVRCEPKGRALCRFDAQGPFADGRRRVGAVDLDISRVELEVEESAAEMTRWTAARAADKGKFAGTGPRPSRYVPGMLLVAFPAGVSVEQAEKLAAGEGFKIQSTTVLGDGTVAMSLLFPPQVTIEDAETRLSGRVRYAQPNWLHELITR